MSDVHVQAPPAKQHMAAPRPVPRGADFISILFPAGDATLDAVQASQPDCFRDLHLDDIVSAVTAGKDEYDLKPFFNVTPTSEEEVKWRQEIVADVEQSEIAVLLNRFATLLRQMRAAQEKAESRHYSLEKLRWSFDAILAYGEAVEALAHELAKANPGSRGFKAFRAYLEERRCAPDFVRLLTDARELAGELASVRYCVEIDGAFVEVRNFAEQADYGADVAQVFERFRQLDSTKPTLSFETDARMTQVDEKVLDRVALLNLDLFQRLDFFCAEHQEFADPLLIRFDREIQFYISYLELVVRLGTRGVAFCHAEVGRSSKRMKVKQGVDLALAISLVRDNAIPVANDLTMSGRERIIVVSGPNQGGKTTFARMVGQMHYLAALGLPVPAASARLNLCDAIVTHFDREETTATPGGKLHDDLIRIHAILEHATSKSLIILNETFTSTTVRDAVRLSRRIASDILKRDAVCVWVTFLHELTEIGDQAVSMVSQVAPDDPAKRTFKILGRPANGSAYAVAIAGKYGLVAEALELRLRGRR